MSGNLPLDWIAFFLLVAMIIAAVIGETLWLVRKGWATSGKAILYVLISDLLGFGIGFAIIMAVMLALLMMVLGPAGRGSNTPDAAYILVTAAAVILPLLLLFISKRAMLAILKIRDGKGAWLYSIISSLLITAFVTIPPILITIALGYATSWK